MQLLPDGTRRYAPKDLAAYLAGDFAAWCERLQAEGAPVPAEIAARVHEFRPDEDPEQELAARKGIEHEQRYLASLQERTPGLIEIQHKDPEAAAKTFAAMHAGAPVIYQGRLDAGNWHGYPDFLYRADDTATGTHYYIPWDTKLARSVKPYFLIQLCAYARLLEAVLGRRPDELVLVLGDGTVQRFRTGDFFHYYRRFERGFLTFQDRWRPDAIPDPGLDRSWGQWKEAATALLEARDHPSQVARITRAQVHRLEEAGIGTLHALAQLDGRPVPGISARVLEQLVTQARLQVESAAAPLPAWRIRPPTADEPRRGLAQLPPPAPGDVFFDMEGFPFAADGLEYLFGAVTVEPDGPRFHDWWAHDAAEERRAFEAIIDWVHARWRADRAMHIYHYASYEKSAMRNLMVKYATREREVDDLLRGEVLVDLYAVVRQGLFVGTPSYSLKEIERLYRPPRQGSVTNADTSVIEYQRWLDEGEPRDWRASPILKGIRDYNRDDCESTLELYRWLGARQKEAGIAYVPAREEVPEPADPEETTPAEALAARLLARVDGGAEPDPERARVTRLVAWLVEYHRREEKPMWWRMFDRHARTEDELARDLDCLTGLTRTSTPPRQIKRSLGLEYAFDPDQDTKLHVESKCYIAGDLTLRTEIVSMDQDRGLIELKVGPTTTLPGRLSLIPDEFVSAEPIKEALFRCAEAWEAGKVVSPAVDDLLFRRPPRVRGHTGGPLIPTGADQLRSVIEVARRLDGTTLAIQGPPGTGKTYTAGEIIAHLLDQGARVGIAANSHKVVLNLLKAVVEARQRGAHKPARLYKVGEDGDDLLIASGAVSLVKSGDAAGALGDGPVVMGGTAWVFSRPELQGSFDYLFIDEAGQVSLANAVAMGLSTRNLVLIGDQMQLGQPSQVVHPGESGLSCLEYVLQGHATVPEHLGIFLGVSRRLNPAVCRFISDAIYEGRLTNLAETERHRVFRSKGTTLVPAEAGVAFVPVEHDGCDQASNEEVETIARIVAELLGRTVTDRHGGPRPMRLSDMLFVAPYNMQVRRLKHRFGTDARVGSVDKFQGQEAPVVIVSLCASSLDDSPRGAEFLLNPNRLNVAVSRAEALAIVVASPGLLDTRCRSVREMRLVNLLCRLEQYAGEEQAP